MQKVAIVLPLYKINPPAQEIFSIKNNFSQLSDYPKYIVAPDGFNSEDYGDILKQNKIIFLAKHWFKNLKSYNKLMLTKEFYQLFDEFEYILIIQPDALVFQDELNDWCMKGYSYIGAPWPNGKILYQYSFRGHSLVRKILPFFNIPTKCYVGNGGLSLRKVKDCLFILQKYYWVVKYWSGQEDYFWAYYFLNQSNNCKIPSENEASKFSLEREAEKYYKMNGFKLPFGCHAYERYDADFWKNIIPDRIVMS